MIFITAEVGGLPELFPQDLPGRFVEQPFPIHRLDMQW
jgi:hypothetical protein